ncbi:MAG: hypothetical protein IJC37_02975 [Clostridia bacterium]|nr:hypothetical protein [Clostridia bacterium]
MKNEKAHTYSIWGIIFTSLVGTLLHFTYSLSGQSQTVALFSAVNESTWEHNKLIFFPFLIFTVIEYFVYGKNSKNFFAAKLIGVAAGMFTVASVFYTYSGILGTNYAIVNILIFILGVIVAYYVSYKIIEAETLLSNSFLQVISIAAFIAICAAYFIFTFNTPEIGIFKDPVTGSYGI